MTQFLNDTGASPTNLTAESEGEVSIRPAASRRTGQGIKNRYVRRTIELHPDVDALLEMLQEKLCARSHSEVLQRAVQILGAMATEQEKGVKIFVEAPGRKMEQVRIF